MDKKIQALFGLKFNPFSPSIPAQALHCLPSVEQFCWRVEHQVRDGGFALVTGDPGTGKSAALRILSARLSAMRDMQVGLLTRPQASVSDFYRELGHLFAVTLSPHNRWGGTKALRQRWNEHIETSITRPVLLADEAQEMRTEVLSELRLLSSTDLDSRMLLTVILAGDNRLGARLQNPDLVPVASRVRTRLRTEALTPEQLGECLTGLLKQAGNPKLMTAQVVLALSGHAAGNLRCMANMANELLTMAAHKELDQIDESLYFQVFGESTTGAARRRRS